MSSDEDSDDDGNNSSDNSGDEILLPLTIKEEDDEKILPAPKRQIKPKEACGLDLRWTFPVDEYDAQSAKVLSTLSYFMLKMRRELTETELMGYVYVWLTLCHALNQVNPTSYGSRNMAYKWRHLACSCFRFEIVARLHEVCYQTLQCCMDNLYDMVQQHSVAPVVLNAPVKHIVPFEHKELCRLLRAQVEMCQLTVALVHRKWVDFKDAWRDTKPNETDVAWLSPAHTSTLGVIASHLYQTLVTLHTKPKDRGYNADRFCRLCWQSAAVFSVAQSTLPMQDLELPRANLRRLSAQLQIAVFRLKVNQADAKKLWGEAAFFTRKILAILGNSPLANADKNLVVAYDRKTIDHGAVPYDPKDPTTRKLIQDLDESIMPMGLTPQTVMTLDPGVISELLTEANAYYGHPLPEFPQMRLRYRNGDIFCPVPHSLDELLKR